MSPIPPMQGKVQTLPAASSGKNFWQSLVFQSGTLLLATALSYVSVFRFSQTRTAQAVLDNPVLAALNGIELDTDGNADEAELIQTALAQPKKRLKLRLPLSNIYYGGTGRVMLGMASWYGPGFHGRRAADGSRFDMNELTAAHKTLPFGTVLRVTNQRTGKSCLVRITDRGPYIPGRVIDLSKAAAQAIGMLGSGTAPVKLEVMSPRDTQMAERLHEINSDA